MGMAVKTVNWAGWDGTSSEHLEYAETPENVTAISRYSEGDYRARYEIVCDANWHVRMTSIYMPDKTIHLNADGNGTWSNESGTLLEELAGAIDIDLTITPFTNTLPIRRLKLTPGQSAEINVAYVEFPEGKIRTDTQHYTCLNERLYRFEAVEIGFIREIEVDEQGLVTNYPGLFRRV
jgi:hypothetical protein